MASVQDGRHRVRGIEVLERDFGVKGVYVEKAWFKCSELPNLIAKFSWKTREEVKALRFRGGKG